MTSPARKLRRRTGAAIGTLAAVLATMLGIPGTTHAAAACGVKLAYLGPLTGPAASFGIPTVNGAQLAVSQYNASHAGCEVTLMTYDSQGDPSQAQPLAQAIVADDTILGVVGPAFSGESLATGHTFAQASLPTISPSATNPTIGSRGWKTSHRLVANDYVVGTLLAKYVTTKLKRTRVAVVGDNSDYGRALARVVRGKLGKKAVLAASVRQGQRNFSVLAKKVRAKRVTAVVYGGYYSEAGRFAKQLNQAGYKGPFLSGDGVLAPAFAALAGSKVAARAHIAMGTAPTNLNASFAQAYRAAFGSAPRYGSIEAYDAARVFLVAIGAGASTRAAMLARVDNYNGQGLTKRIAFNGAGNVIRPPVWLYQPKGRAFTVRSRIQ